MGPEELTEYLVPVAITIHDPAGDYAGDKIGVMNSDGTYVILSGEQNIINAFTNKENLYKQFLANFNYYSRPTPWPSNFSESLILKLDAFVRLMNTFGLERYKLLKQKIWPPSGEIFEFGAGFRFHFAGTP